MQHPGYSQKHRLTSPSFASTTVFVNLPPMTNSSLPHVVIIGAGFGGLNCAQKLMRKPVRITIIDRQNHHLFQPLLYQVATAGLAAPEIAYPIRNIFRRRKNVSVLLGNVLDVDTQDNKVILREREISFDYLVIATGGKTTYFGHAEWKKHAPGLKTMDDAMAIRHQVLLAYERAEAESDPRRREELLTTVVVGGGPTGVEMAGALAELGKRILPPDFRQFDGRSTRILLVEAAPRVLTPYHESLSAKARRQLESLGVEVFTGTPVKDIREGQITFGDHTVRAANIIWGGGIEGTSLNRQLGVPLNKAGRLKVEPDLTLPGHPRIFGLGDAIALTDSRGVQVPGVAPAAMQMGKYVARRIAAEVAGKNPDSKSFAYWDKGMMATIGRARAVAQVGRFRLSGFPAWLAWLFIHLLFLVGAHNKVFVFLDWIYNYLNFRRGARLIVRPDSEITRLSDVEG